jgi:hypothetical protein
VAAPPAPSADVVDLPVELRWQTQVARLRLVDWRTSIAEGP